MRHSSFPAKQKGAHAPPAHESALRPLIHLRLCLRIAIHSIPGKKNRHFFKILIIFQILCHLDSIPPGGYGYDCRKNRILSTVWFTRASGRFGPTSTIHLETLLDGSLPEAGLWPVSKISSLERFLGLTSGRHRTLCVPEHRICR